MRIIQRRQYHESVHYSLYFEYEDCEGAGYSFDCDEDGKVLLSNLTVIGARNLAKCLNGEHKVRRGRILSFENRWVEPAIGECDCCGEEVELRGFTNTCSCGADYNMSGDQLADRSQWGECEGDSLSDILSIDYTSTENLLDGQ